MSCAEALRRCPQAIFVRPRHSEYRQLLPPGLGRGRARSSRRSSARVSTRATSSSDEVVRTSARRAGRRGGAGRRARRDRAHVLARRRDVQGRRQGGERPSQAGRRRGRSAGQEADVPRAARGPRPAGRGPAGRGAPAPAGVDIDRPPRGALRRRAGAAPAGNDRGVFFATAPAAIDPRRLGEPSRTSRISQEETFARDVDDRSASTRSSAGWPARLAEKLAGSGQLRAAR